MNIWMIEGKWTRSDCHIWNQTVYCHVVGNSPLRLKVSVCWCYLLFESRYGNRYVVGIPPRYKLAVFGENLIARKKSSSIFQMLCLDYLVKVNSVHSYGHVTSRTESNVFFKH